MREKTQNSIYRHNKFHSLLKWLFVISIYNFIRIAMLLLFYTNYNLSPD